MRRNVSVICDYCPCTDYGDVVINTDPSNQCEGCSCDIAYDAWKDSDPENNTASMEELF